MCVCVCVCAGGEWNGMHVITVCMRILWTLHDNTNSLNKKDTFVCLSLGPGLSYVVMSLQVIILAVPFILVDLSPITGLYVGEL